MRNSSRSAVAFVLVLGMGRLASAHAFLDHAEPKVGQTVSTSPKEVKIWFDEDVQASQCKIVVRDSSGKQVDRQDTHGDPKDASLLTVSLADLPAGTYTVNWTAVCPESHHTQGTFKFEVKSGS